MEKQKVGKVFTYFANVEVAGIKVEEGELKIGDKILIQGHTTNFEQTLESMQIDRNPIEIAKAGDEIGVKVKDRVRPNDIVYKLIEEE
jgi:translation elongation factor EF-1alpha